MDDMVLLVLLLLLLLGWAAIRFGPDESLALPLLTAPAVASDSRQNGLSGEWQHRPCDFSTTTAATEP